MTPSSLAKYHARQPRYILQPHDNTFIRVAGPKQLPWEEGTEIRNISLSGLSFMAPSDLCPIVGEVIKIQFEVPGKSQMACHGLATRLEPMGHHSMLVGVQFIKMEMPQRLALLQGLAQKLKEQQTRNERESKAHYTRYLAQSLVYLWPQWLVMGSAFAGWASIFFAITAILAR
jgi:hypothetical protein